MASLALGSVTVENRTPFRRLVMQVATLPLRDGEYRLPEPITAMGTGTGHDERCQVESWALPYASGCERVVRVTYPAILEANDLRGMHAFEKSDRGLLDGPAFPPAVVAALPALQFAFVVGPKATHHVAWAATETPEVVHNGPRSVLLRWFRRVPRSQWWCEVDLELFLGQHYGVLHFRGGYCDPRLADDGDERWLLSDDDTEIGLFLTAGSLFGAQPVPLYQDHSTRRCEWRQGRWEWVVDRRTFGQFGGPVNNFIPWGAGFSTKAVLLFHGDGSLHDDLLDSSMLAWTDGGKLTFPHAVSNDWLAKQEAYGPCGRLMRKPKRHEHWDMNRDAEFVRGKLESTDVHALYDSTSVIPGGNLWTSHHAQRSQVWGGVQGDGPGSHASWGIQPLYAAVAYAVPGLAHAHERGIYACPWPYFYREVDGAIVNALDHPDLVIDRGAPGRVGNFGDMLGKTALQRWRGAGANQFTIRYERTGEAYQGADEAHFECANVVAHHVIFGDRGTRRIAEGIAYTHHAGDWSRHQIFRGSTGQARGFARGLRAASWLAWAFGSDARLLDHYAGIFDHRYVPARAREDARFPGRVIKTVSVFEANPNAPNTRVELRRHRYFRPWEDGLGVDGCVGLARLLDATHPEQAMGYRQLAHDTASDVLRYGSPRIVDEATAQITFDAALPYNIALAAAFLDGTRKLTADEIADNNYSRCGGYVQCVDSGEGYLKVEGGSASFCWPLFWWVVGDVGSSGSAVLCRYVPVNLLTMEPRSERPGDYSHGAWLLGLSRYSGCGSQDRIVLGAAQVVGPPSEIADPVPIPPADRGLAIDLSEVVVAAQDVDGRLLALLGPGGEVHVYGRGGPGSVWGVARVRRTFPGAVGVAFKRHGREEDGQRLLVVDAGGAWAAVEV